MLTPMDIQQKRFHVGIGFDKKDVLTFFETVAESYEKLYRSNAELKEKVSTLEDNLQNYKSKEASLEKTILLAEKDSEDKKSKASKEAKSIEMDAKNKAKSIIGDAEERLAEAEAQMEMLKTEYAAYKSSFASLLKMHFNKLKEEDFDVDCYIDPKYAGMFMGGAPAPQQQQGGGSLGEFNGDPQMRDQSTLGGGGGYTGMSMDSGAKATSSEVYTSLLKDNENFVDPFNPKEDNGRYNPYDGRTASSSKSDKSSSTTFTVAGQNKGKSKAKTNAAKKASANESTKSDSGKAQSPSLDNSKFAASESKETFADTDNKTVNEPIAESTNVSNDAVAESSNVSNDTVAESSNVSNDTVAESTNVASDTVAEDSTMDSKSTESAEESTTRIKAMSFFKNAQAHVDHNHSADDSSVSDDMDSVKSDIQADISDSDKSNSQDDSEDELIGEVEESVNGKMLIGDGLDTDDSEDDGLDEFGFEFIE